MGEVATDISIVVFLISLIIIITFFIMASRLKSIKETLANILKLELRKPENRIDITCAKCKEVYSVSALRKGERVKCKKCNELNWVP